MLLALFAHFLFIIFKIHFTSKLKVNSCPKYEQTVDILRMQLIS